MYNEKNSCNEVNSMNCCEPEEPVSGMHQKFYDVRARIDVLDKRLRYIRKILTANECEKVKEDIAIEPHKISLVENLLYLESQLDNLQSIVIDINEALGIK